MQQELEVTRSLSMAELKDLAGVTGPCITMYVPLSTTPSSLRSGIREVESKLTELFPEFPSSDIRSLTANMEDALPGGNGQPGQPGTLVILRSLDVFRTFELKESLEQNVVVGESFYLFPLIHSLQLAEQMFYLLALSQNHVRLLRCTRESSEQVPLAEGTPVSLEEWLNTRLPNSAPDHGTLRQSDGSMSGSFTASNQDRDNKDQHIFNYFHVINKAVFDILRNERAPLVLCGVEYERVMYKGINQYQYLLDEGVQGSPESLKGGEMHARALDVVQDFFAGPAKKALGIWEKIAGTERVSTSFPDIVKGAFQARVATLFALEGAQTMGAFDRSALEMKVQGRHEDLVNAAALQTIAFGGDVFILNQNDMPGDGQLAAIFRF